MPWSEYLTRTRRKNHWMFLLYNQRCICSKHNITDNLCVKSNQNATSNVTVVKHMSISISKEMIGALQVQ